MHACVITLRIEGRWLPAWPAARALPEIMALYGRHLHVQSRRRRLHGNRHHHHQRQARAGRMDRSRGARAGGARSAAVRRARALFLLPRQKFVHFRDDARGYGTVAAHDKLHLFFRPSPRQPAPGKSPNSSAASPKWPSTASRCGASRPAMSASTMSAEVGRQLRLPAGLIFHVALLRDDRAQAIRAVAAASGAGTGSTGGSSAHQQLFAPASLPQTKTAPQRGQLRSPARRPAIRDGEESVSCSTALSRSCFISADFSSFIATRGAGRARRATAAPGRRGSAAAAWP